MSVILAAALAAAMADGWTFDCPAGGACVAARRYRGTIVSLAGEGGAFTATVSGGCGAAPDVLQVRRDWSGERLSAEARAEEASDLAVRILSARLRRCEDAPPRKGFFRSLRDAAARVLAGRPS